LDTIHAEPLTDHGRATQTKNINLKVLREADMAEKKFQEPEKEVDERTKAEIKKMVVELKVALLNLLEQDLAMLRVCQERGINPADTFRMYYDKDRNEWIFIVSGEEGSEKLREDLQALVSRIRNQESVPVEVRTVRRFEL